MQGLKTSKQGVRRSENVSIHLTRDGDAPEEDVIVEVPVVGDGIDDGVLTGWLLTKQVSHSTRTVWAGPFSGKSPRPARGVTPTGLTLERVRQGNQRVGPGSRQGEADDLAKGR